MKPVPADAVIVDLDGTLVDTLGDFEVALNAMLADLQLPCVEREDVRRWVGRGSEHLIACALTHTTGQPDGGLAAPGWLHYQRHYARINGRHSAVYPGALDALQAWQHRGLLLACLTNKPAAFARSLLRMKGLEGCFVRVFGGDDFPEKKPHPLPVLKTCEALGTVPQRTLVVGDSRNDAQAGRAAGCPVVLVTYGYNHGEPVTGVDADGWVASMQDIALA